MARYLTVLFKLTLLKKTFLLILLAIVVAISAFVAYGAYIDRTKYKTEKLVIIPDSVTSDSWSGLNSVLVQDISEYSLYQDFTTDNSAYISELGLYSRNKPDPASSNDVPVSATSSTSTSAATVTASSSLEKPATPASEAPVIPAVETPPPTVVAPVTPPEQSSPSPTPTLTEPVSLRLLESYERTTVAFKKAAPYLFAQATIDEPAASNTNVTPTPAINLPAELPKSVVIPSNATSEPHAPIPVTLSATASAATDSTATSAVEHSSTTMPTTSVVPVASGTTVAADAHDFKLAPCLVEENCTTHSMLFKGFILPDFESGTVLDSIQLRLSLAAQTKKNRGTGPQRYVIEYTYDIASSTQTWTTASIIDIGDEISNSINGGYFLETLATPKTAGEIANLQVRVSYQGNVADLNRAYVEGVWLEVTSGSFYEEGDGKPYTDELKYSRNLLQPHLNTLDNNQLDPTLGNLPSFNLSYDPQQNFFSRLLTSIFSVNTFAVNQITLTDSEGTVISVPIAVDYHPDSSWTLRIEQQPQSLRPGKYTVKAIMLENGSSYQESFEFYWGMLAVNTKKSMYAPNEDVELNMAALTSDGTTICDANLHLKIIDPKNNIFEVPVTQSGDCGRNNVTEKPDYLAHFTNTGEWGKYTIQLENRNTAGEVVHKIQDSFEVRDYIPYDIVRTAPTRIFPPAPYTVKLDITAHRDFDGDITERVPRGFTMDPIPGALISTLPRYTLITWKDKSMKVGDVLHLSYTFKAPDVSPYMYLLGPLDMDGFSELRQWQIASDALNNIGWFTGTRTIGGTNLNATPSPFQWSSSSVDNYYFSHSTSTNSHQVTLRQDGDYLIAVTLPQYRTDANNRGTRGGIEVRVNGVAVPQGLGRSGYIFNTAAENESSSHVSFLLTGAHANDYVEVYEENLDNITIGDTLLVSNQAAMYLEYISPTENAFAATTTQTTSSTNLNQISPFGMTWTETRQDSAYSHSDVVSPQNITIIATGTYMVHINIPMTGITNTVQTNLIGKVLLGGNLVAGGLFQQGYLQASTTESDPDASIHWSGIIVATTTNQVLTITVQAEAGIGTTTVTPNFVGSIYMQKLPSLGVIAVSGANLQSGANWNTAATSSVLYSSRWAYDATTFTHSTTTNSQQVTIAQSGDYLMTLTDALGGGLVANSNARVTVQLGGITVRGAETKSNYVRAQNGHSDSSGSLVYLLTGVTAGQILTISSVQEGALGTLNANDQSMLMLWKKMALDFRPPAPTTYGIPFDNERVASTSPYFDFSSDDPDGSSRIQYEFSISTSSAFATATVRTSGISAGFTNMASTTDVSPFLETNKIRFQLQNADALTDLTTYYWRVRAKDVTGSNSYGDWSTTQSITVNAVNTIPDWYQTLNGQFQSDTLVGTFSSSLTDNVQVNSTVSSEILVAYGDSTTLIPKYRLWTGTSWGIELTALTVGGTVNWVRTAAGISRDEYILVTIDQSNASYAQVYSASTTSWANKTTMSTNVFDITRRGIGVTYESLSGRAMVVSCDNGANPVYRLWNGTSWTATSSIPVTSTNGCNSIELASNPISNEIIMIERDTNSAYEAVVWNGSTWGNRHTLGTPVNAALGRVAMALSYETSGNQAIVVSQNGTGNSFIYSTWDGSVWSVNAVQPLFNDFDFGKLTSDPTSDKMVLCYIDASNHVGTVRWDGAVWSTYAEQTITGNSAIGRPTDCEYETVAGRSGNIMNAYSDQTSALYSVFASSSWSAQQTIAGMGSGLGLFWVQTARAGDGTIVSMMHDDNGADKIESTYWNGTSWAVKQTIVPNPSSVLAAPYETFEMAAKRFQFTQGTVLSTPISFNSVANQITWGDVSFTTTEPAGTNVLLRIKYTSTTTCDSYIPNAVLPGNIAGFAATTSPVVLTALSTSTYSQICLEATLTSQGGSSASLNDWNVSWYRQPKLTESTFRWYGNGSYLTPVDPWPLGISDVLENTALTASVAVSINEVIRLRLSLLGVNVALATTTSAFKLQYAAGASCSAITNWSDVGDAASTTAIWRGYGNSIVGSDWYNSSWGKRLAITITNSLVSGTQTNFPVYVNLADFPAAFFSSVRSDGADIRITSSDGVTEAPYELVSINTSAKTGELHFKANLSSASTTVYYLYYSNATGTAYATNATYGSQNVWTNGYAGVYHLNQDPTGSSPQITDSTSNARNAARTGTASSGRLVSAKLGNGLDFFGTSGDYTIDFPTFGLGSTSSYTYSAWFKTTTTTNGLASDVNGTYLADRTASTTDLASLKVIGGKFAHQYRYTDGTGLGALSGNTIATTSWQYVVWGRSYNVNRFIFTDGTQATTTDAINGLTPPLLRLGGHQTNTNFTGLADELRIATNARPASWVTTEYNNQTNATGFYSLSSEEQINDGRQLPSVVLSSSTYPETYEEYNPTRTNLHAIGVGERSEWDFALQNHAAGASTNYCFRMVYSDGSTLNSYAVYPKLVTNAPPLAPVLSAPFDNKKVASSSPWFEFTATDQLSDQVSYQISVDTDYAFGAPVFTQDSNVNFALFANLLTPAERSLYTSGQTIRFIPNSALVNGTTYWWRVRAKDDNGSGTYGAWSVPQSFTVGTSTTLTTWFQTTGDQFNTDTVTDGVTSTSTNDIGIAVSFTVATNTTTAIVYSNRDVGNAWGSVSFTEATTSGTIKHYVEYLVSGTTWALVPDVDLPTNSSGFTSSPISIASLDTSTYGQIRITSVFAGNSTLPRLQDISVSWSQKIDPPTLLTLFDNAKSATTTPAFTFTTTDPQGDNLQYETQFSTSYAFTASTTFMSGSSTGFTNVTTATNTSPFYSGQTIQYQTQSAFTNGTTYWWRVRARDPLGSNSWSNYSTRQSFTIDTATTFSVWHQTTGEQFANDNLVNIETTTGGAQITSVITGVMTAYGEGTGQAPQYRLWNGSTWSSAASAVPVNAQIRWTRLKAAPTRSEYSLATLGTDLDVHVQIYNGLTQSWANNLTLYDNSNNATKRSYDISYETVSGRLMAVSCVGVNAVYALWNGTSWSATTTIALANGNTCEWVQMASNPISNEIIAVFRHTNTGTPDFEALVWNGSSWGNSKRFGDVSGTANEDIAVQYQESAAQALVVLPNTAAASMLWSSWNGSTWSTVNTTALSASMVWGNLKRDVGTDRMVLCTMDTNTDIGVMPWTGSAWGAQTIVTAIGNDNRGLPADCEFQTTQGTDGNIVIPYSDTAAARYQTYNYASGTYSGEFSLDTINNSWRLQTVRAGDGTIHMIAFDDASVPKRYDTSRWNGSSWTTKQSLSTNPSITVLPYDGSVTLAAQIYPSFTSGSIRSTPITFSDGGSPRWERVRFSDTTPGTSDILYRVYYESSPGVYALVPDTDLSNNSSGFTNSPIDISGLDRTVYTKLELDAQFVCSSGSCPTIQDWSVEWSAGITVSGSALEYDQTTVTASGTIAIAINGVLQPGKTATIASGTTTQQAIFTTSGMSTFAVPSGVTSLTIKAWGAGGGSGAGGTADAGGAGGGAGFTQATITSIPAENLSIFIGGGGGAGGKGVPPGAGGGGGYSAVMRSSTPLVVAAAGGGGGAGDGGISFVGVGTACAVTAASCSTMTLPASTQVNDVLIAVLHSRTNTAHACLANCTGWTEFSTQTGTVGDGRLSLWYYRQTGVAPAAPTFNGPLTESYTGRIWAFRGVATSGNPYDVLGTNASVAAALTYNGSNLTSTVPDAMVVMANASMLNNTWGPASGALNMPTSIDVNYYTANANGTRNSISLGYQRYASSTASALGIPANTQSGSTAGRSFTFVLKPQSSSIVAAGSGGVGGGVIGGAGVTASTTIGGGGGTQSTGGAIGGGNATVGSAYTGGNGSSGGAGGGAGGAGGTNGGGAGGAGASTTLAAGGGAGGAGYYGGGGGSSALSQYVSGAGGGGGSSYIVSGAGATSTVSGSSTIAGNATDTDYAVGVGTGGAGGATSSNGTVGGVGRVVVTWTTVAAPGAWSIANVAAFPGDIITAFVQSATGTSRAVGVTKYDGVGNISGMQLSKRHLTIGSNDAPTITNADLSLYTNSNTADVFYSTAAGNVITLCAQTTCSDARLRILVGSTYQPGANSNVINFENSGTFVPTTNTLRVSSVWSQQGIFTPGLSTIIFNATSSSFTPLTASSTLDFYNLNFGETSGAATWIINKPLNVQGSLTVDKGTLARGTSTIAVQNNLSINVGGAMTGLATTTLLGSVSSVWSDVSASGTNIGYAVIDGNSKTVTLGSNVTAQTVTIGSDDTLNSSGSGYGMSVINGWFNNNAFIAQTGTVTFTGTTTNTIYSGASSFNNITFSGVGGLWSFATSTLGITGNLTIATGTVNLPTGTTTIAGSFLNTGGTFMHNNGEVRMTSSAAGKTITQRAGTFLNAFYDLVFTGTGAWSYSETAATTTHALRIQNGTVTLPSATLSVGGDFIVSGSGAFAHNSGELDALVQSTSTIQLNGSSLNNLRLPGTAGFTRTFIDTNATILGNYVSEIGGTTVFPLGTLSVGGSFTNGTSTIFASNNGTVKFNATAGAKTIAVGSSTFASVDFNSGTGDFTITQNATATVAFSLTNVGQFTLQSGKIVEAAGTFSNAANGASTTWTGSTLRLTGADGAMNLKTSAGDVYGTLDTQGDTDVTMWNSSATNYVTGSTSSIYSQDHAGVRGALNIYGNYVRTTGTEYWSYATDFDGTALTASTSRQVNVRAATSTVIGFTNASFNIVGGASASTTIDAIGTGSYSITASNTTLTAQNFRVANTDTTGLGLFASSTLSTFTDGFFTVVPGRTGITIASSTVSKNAAGQYFRIGFATSSLGSASNVTLIGTSSTFVWFRLGSGNLYGENYNANDGNPGSIRFDDSSNLVTISGVVYADDGVTPMGSPTCNGVTPNVRIVINSGSYTASTSCAAGTGAYTLTNVGYTGDPRVVVYLNTNGGAVGTVVTKTLTNNVTNMNIYANRVIVRHEDVLPLTIADMGSYDFNSDTDIKYTASSSLLTTQPNTELYVFASSTFIPGGNIILLGAGTSTSYDGTLQIGANATFIASSTETHTLGGRLVLATTSTLTTASSTFIFNATTSGKSITSPNIITFNTVSFTGVGGGWNITAPLSVLGNMNVNAGTVTGTNNITLTSGSLLGNGILSLGSGTTTLQSSNTLGGTTPWTFANLVLGSSSVVGTTTMATTATTSVSGRLTISNAHTLVASSTKWDLTGVGTVFAVAGTFTPGTSMFRYSGSGAIVTASTYYDMDINAGVGTQTYTAAAGGITVQNNLTMGGVATTTFDVTANDPVLIVNGNVTIRPNGTLSASDINGLTAAGNWTNTGTFTSNNGTVTFTALTSATISAGNSSFATAIVNGPGAFTMTGNATATVAFNLTNHSAFTLSSSSVLAIGGSFTNSIAGAATTWSGSTLYFFGGGTKTINASTTTDVYDTLTVAPGTNLKMWNSSAATYNAIGGIYSQNQAGVTGNLNIYGAYALTSGSEYWSYATNFDGTALGGSSRAVTVSFASSSSFVATGGSLEVKGTTTASTTLQNQGTGTYSLSISGPVTTEWNYVRVRNINANGVVLSGTPTIVDFSNTDHVIAINGGTGVTVGGTVIDANQAKNFSGNVFATTSPATNAFNVTATGTSVSSWRFTNHTGALSGEAYDSDPAGDPGYLVWADSAALITISGHVYSDEGVTVSTVCNGVTPSIVLRVAGLTSYATSCAAGTGAYSIPNVSFSANDTLTLYIDNSVKKAVNVSTEPVSSISNMDLYENRVIVRHESSNPMTIAKMAAWNSSNDGDILFTTSLGAPNTLTLAADQKLLVWTGKTFAPGGNVTLSGGGSGASQDGTFEAQTGATFRAAGSETHSIGGSFIFNPGSTFIPAQSTTTFTTTGVARTISTNGASFYNVAFTGAGSWTVATSNFATQRSYTQSNGTVTFGFGTTTIGASFNVTGGSFSMSTAGLLFISTTTGNTVRTNNVIVPGLRFAGAGGAWAMTDTNATTTGAFTVTAGTVTLPSGNFAVGRNFENLGGTIVHNNANLIMTAASSANLSASSSSLFSVKFTGAGPFTMTDVNMTMLDSLTLATGTLTMATGTVSVGGDFLTASGTVNNASGTILLNASTVGKVVTFGTNPFYNVVFGSASGGWTLFGNATTTNNFSITGASSFTKDPTTTLNVGGVFTNLVGGVNTTWAASILRLYGTSGYTINTKSTGGDVYGTISLATGTNIRMWNSGAATTIVAAGSSLYSQNHNAVNGALNIYGDFTIATTSEYWSYATDFDGTALGGSSRAVSVRLDQNATTTLSSGSLSIIGVAGATSSIARQATGTYTFKVTGGTLNAQYYSFANLDVNGLQFIGAPTITNLSNGYFDLAVASGSLITVPATTLDANASKIFTNIGFNATGISGFNVQVTGVSTNAWRLTGGYGNIGGENYDIDGATACGSIRFDDSSCLLTTEANYRWRNDDGGEGVPTTDWFNTGFTYRKQVRVNNADATAYTSSAVKIAVTYDSSMQSNFGDLRFTSSDGQTTIPYWVERYTASTDATVWVRVPNLPAGSITPVYMYFGSSTVSTTGSSTTTFTAVDDFEDNNITKYSGDTAMFQTNTTPVYGGSYALTAAAASKSGVTTNGIFRTSLTGAQGQILRWMQYIDTVAGAGDEGCTLFGVQSPGTLHNNYAVCLELFGPDRLVLSKNVTSDSQSGTIIASTTVLYTSGWYEVEVDWKTSNLMNVYLRNSAGSLVATTSATDASYTTGGMGFSFWVQNGAWDDFTVRSKAMISPTIYYGAKQTYGGANWLAAQNTIGNAAPGNTKRIRFDIENTGLNVTGQVYRLEYANKGAAPTCEAVTNANFATVPNQLSCGTSPVCMQTSSNVTDGNPTTDLLATTTGTFTAGQYVKSPSNAAASMNLTQNYYTELEYVITPTINATSSYCFRVSNAGTALDYYAKVAELSLSFSPTFGVVTLNSGNPITLTPGATTTIYATGTVTDLNGYTDMVAGSSTIYRSGVGPSCVANQNNCYKSNTASSSCLLTNCSGNTCELRCSADIYFFADPTDIGTYSGQDWQAYLEVNDLAGGYDFSSAIGQEVLTLRALNVGSAISYGTLAVAADTGSTNASTSVSNLGNTSFNLNINGTDLTANAGASNIPAAQQKFATSTFTYSSCVSCSILSTSSVNVLNIGLAKSTIPTPVPTTAVYWGIAIPNGTASTAHSGTNIFTPV